MKIRPSDDYDFQAVRMGEISVPSYFLWPHKGFLKRENWFFPQKQVKDNSSDLPPALFSFEGIFSQCTGAVFPSVFRLSHHKRLRPPPRPMRGDG